PEVLVAGEPARVGKDVPEQLGEPEHDAEQHPGRGPLAQLEDLRLEAPDHRPVLPLSVISRNTSSRVRSSGRSSVRTTSASARARLTRPACSGSVRSREAASATATLPGATRRSRGAPG